MCSLWDLGDSIAAGARLSLGPVACFAHLLQGMGLVVDLLLSATLPPSDKGGPILTGGNFNRLLAQSTLRGRGLRRRVELDLRQVPNTRDESCCRHHHDHHGIDPMQSHIRRLGSGCG